VFLAFRYMWPWPCDLVNITADGILELNYNLIAFQSKADHPRMRAFRYIFCYFQSRDKDGSPTTRFAISKNPMLCANFTALWVLELELMPIDVFFHCGIRDFFYFFCSCDLDLDLMTGIPSRCTEDQNWISCVKDSKVSVLQTYRHYIHRLHTPPKVYSTIARRSAGGKWVVTVKNYL